MMRDVKITEPELIKAIRAHKIETDPESRWSAGIEHHPRTEALVDLMSVLPNTGLDFGGDGDNGEAFAYALDVIFEAEELHNGAPDEA